MTIQTTGDTGPQHRPEGLPEGLPERLDVLTQFWEGGVRTELGLEENDLEAVLGVANMKLKAGDQATAQRMYLALVLCDPGNFKFQQGLANVCLKTGEFDAVVQTASVMVMLKPDDPTGYYFSGAACLALGHLAEAREDITDALAFAQQKQDAVLVGECRRLLLQLDAQ
ncbi:hypothetical protein [Roseibium sp.]|uniref:hypothetical protein n=1 Tax=Roseibium sp. TaxID=1936156 RepID=UPI0032678A79